jgi:hypothetical protein
VGTCFQVDAGVLVTAWHVLCDLDAGAVGGTVGVGQLAGGLTVPATVVRVDPVNDLAVLRCELPLAGSVDGIRETGSVGTGTDVVVSGVAEVDDPEHEVRYLERVAGQWGGQLARDGALLGHLKCRDVVPGMSGAPVTLPGGTQVVGVVSARYNSTTGWLRDSVWVARTEDLVTLLAGVLDRARPLAERLPPGVTELLYRMRETLNELPYAPPGYGRVPLLEVYVSQSVAEPAAQRRPRLDDFDDLEQLQLEREQSQVEKERLALLVQPFDEVFGQHQHLVVQGDGGMGKTTLVNRLVLRLVDAVLDDGAGDSPELTIPVLLPARTLAAQPESTWPAMLRTAVQSEYGPLDSDLPEAIFAAPVAGHRWRIVVDALDEIPDPDSRQRLLVTLAAKMLGTGGPSHFLVTSRPLHPGEIARLQKPGVGCYDLQRFDEDALAAFAKAWLGDTAAGRFLTAVRLARLEDVLQVPLLATVAVQVYLASPDRQLPPSHYQLYQRYIELSVARREEYARQVLAQLPATADGNRLRDWLAGHRWELLEHLAKVYTTSDRQLLPAAEQYLRDRVPELDQLPANWAMMLVHWLAQTGIVNPGRRQLRFTHLIFAEHLAATADARALPPFFDPGRDEFAELLTSARLGIEPAIRTLLYYLHLHEHDPSSLDRLQAGAREDRRLAGQLVAKGAPCTDEQLRVHVAQIEDEALASGVLDPDAVSALIGSPWVRSRLLELLTGPAVGLDSRIGLIDLLHEHSAEAKRFGVTLLRQEVPSAFPYAVRRRGAMVLSRLGAEQRDLAAEVLHGLTANAAADDEDRLQAAEDLARLGPRHRDRAEAALHALAGDVMVSAQQRRGAAYALVKLGGPARDSAAADLHALAADPAANADERRQAAEDLARLGGAHREQGTRDLTAIVADPAVGAGDRAMTLAALAAFDPAGQDRAAEELHAFAADPTADPFDRCAAAEALTRLGSGYRDQAVTDLLGIAADPFVDIQARQQAIAGLTKLGDGRQAQAVAAAIEVAATPDGKAHQRISVFDELAKPGAEHGRDIGGTLHSIAADPTVGAFDRHSAVQLAARLGTQHYEQSAAALENIILDPAVTGLVRSWATPTLAKLGTPWTERTAVQLQAMLRQRWISDEDLLVTAAALAWLRPGGVELAATVLQRIAGTGRAEAWLRWEIANHLADLGQSWISHAMDIRATCVTDPIGGEYFPLQAAQDLIATGWHRSHEVADLVGWLVTCREVDDGRALDTAEELAGRTGVFRERAVAVLEAIAMDPGRPASSRRRAAHRLVQLGVDMSGTLETFAANPLTDDDERLDAIELLIRLRPDTCAPVVAPLCALATGPATDLGVRRRAVRLLARLRPVHRAGVDTRLRALLAAPDGSPAAAFGWVALATLDPDLRAPAAAALRGLLGNADVDADDQLQAAELLLRMGPEHGPLVEDTLAAIASDPRASSLRRRDAAQALAGLRAEHRAVAANLLYAGGADPEAAEWNRRRAALALAELGTEHHEAAVGLLHRIVEDATLLPAQRAEAATAMVVLARQYPALVAGDLRRIATDQACTPADRLAAAQELAKLGGEARAAATALVEQQATDAGSDPGARYDAALALVDLGLTPRPAAIRALRALAAQQGVDVQYRVRAAGQLADLGPPARAGALSILRDLAAERAQPHPLQQALVSAAIAGIDDEHVPTAVDALTELATDGDIAPWQRLVAISALTAVGRHQHGRCARLWFQAATCPPARGWERRIAAEQLARFGPGHRLEALELLAGIADDPAVDPWERVETLSALVRLDPRRCDHVQEHLAALAGDDDVPAAERCAAAVAAAGLGPAGQALAAGALRRIVQDASLDFADRVQAATDFAGTQRGPRAGAALMRPLVEETPADPVRHARALNALCDIDWRHDREARTAVLRLVQDTAASPADRRDGAVVLAEWGGRAATTAAAALLDLATGAAPQDHDTEIDRALAFMELALLRPEHRGAAVAALARLPQDRLTAQQRCDVAAGLAELRPGGRRGDLESLCALVTDPAGGPPDRLYAAKALGRVLSVPGRITGMYFFLNG